MPDHPASSNPSPSDRPDRDEPAFTEADLNEEGIYDFVDDDPTPSPPPIPANKQPTPVSGPTDAPKPKKPVDREYKSLLAQDLEAAIKAGNLRCPDCKYDITGLGINTKCPECGRKITTTTLRVAMERTNAKKTDSPAFAPLACGLAGLALSLTVNGFAYGPIGLLVAFTYIAVTCVVGWGIFFLASVISIGFAASVPMTMLQLFGAYALATGVGDLLSLLPIPIIPWLISVLVLIGLLMKLLDLEQNEAILIAFFTWVAKLLIVAVVVAAIIGAAI